MPLPPASRNYVNKRITFDRIAVYDEFVKSRAQLRRRVREGGEAIGREIVLALSGVHLTHIRALANLIADAHLEEFEELGVTPTDKDEEVILYEALREWYEDCNVVMMDAFDEDLKICEEAGPEWREQFLSHYRSEGQGIEWRVDYSIGMRVARAQRDAAIAARVEQADVHQKMSTQPRNRAANAGRASQTIAVGEAPLARQFIAEHGEGGSLTVREIPGATFTQDAGFARWAVLSALLNGRVGEALSVQDLAGRVDVIWSGFDAQVDGAQLKLDMNKEQQAGAVATASLRSIGARSRERDAYAGRTDKELFDQFQALLRQFDQPGAKAFIGRWIHWNRRQGTVTVEIRPTESGLANAAVSSDGDISP